MCRPAMRQAGSPKAAANFALAIMLENHRPEDPTAPRSGQAFVMLVNRLGGREIRLQTHVPYRRGHRLMLAARLGGRPAGREISRLSRLVPANEVMVGKLLLAEALLEAWKAN